MAIVRNYDNPLNRASYAEQAVQGGGLLGPVDYSGMSYTARGLSDGVASTFLDITGRAATAEELKKYTDLAVAGGDKIFPVIQDIYKDNWDSLDISKQQSNDETGMEGWKREADKYTNEHFFDSDRPANFEDAPFTARATGIYNNRPFRTEDVANFLTKMDATQSAKLFTDVGIKGADSLAQQVSAKSDYKDDGERVSHVNSLGLDDDKLKIIGKAMFSGGSQFNDPTRPGSQHADNNNADYKTNTAYDPTKGLTFTGGFIPDPKKVDWMGQIIKTAILGGMGFVAAPLFTNAVAAGLGSAGTTLGYAGAMVPNALSSGIGGALAGASVGALGAGVSGGNVRKAGLIGGLTGGLAGTISGMSQPDVYGNARNVSITGTNNKFVDSAALGAIRGGISTKANGGDLGDGIVGGAITGGISPVVGRFVPGIAAPIVNSYVNTAIRTALADDPASRTPTSGNVITPQQPVTSVPAINLNRRVG